MLSMDGTSRSLHLYVHEVSVAYQVRLKPPVLRIPESVLRQRPSQDHEQIKESRT